MSKRTVADVVLSPSLMCTDLLSLSDSVRELEEIGVDALHIDLIDSTFSPSMPLGLEVIRQLREKTNLDFDIHIMSMNNEWFIKQALDIGVRRVSFHYETSLHPDRLVNLIKKQKVEAGIALNPATSLRSLDYLLPSLDYVLLMLINPGLPVIKMNSRFLMRKIKSAICMPGLRRQELILQYRLMVESHLPPFLGWSRRGRVIWYSAALGFFSVGPRLWRTSHN